MKYQIYYYRELQREPIITFIRGETHVFIREIEANDLHDVWHLCQGENWSPNGEARELIKKAGTHHTSMSIGDVAIDERGNGWMCSEYDWVLWPSRRA